MKSPECKHCGGVLIDSVAPKSGKPLRYCPACHKKAKRLARSIRPERDAAGSKLRRAVKLGLVARKPCAECGDPKSEFHHPDYSKPLDGEWLCRTHHRRRHQQMRLANTEAAK